MLPWSVSEGLALGAEGFYHPYNRKARGVWGASRYVWGNGENVLLHQNWLSCAMHDTDSRDHSRDGHAKNSTAGTTLALMG